MKTRFIQTIAATLTVTVALIGAVPLSPYAWAQSNGEGGGGNGGASQADSLTQLTNTVQQLAQQVSQVVNVVQNLWNVASGSLFRGLGSSIPSFGGGTSSFSPTSWLSQISQWAQGELGQSQSSTWSEWGSEWGTTPDYNYSAGTIAPELQQISSTVGGSAGQWVATLAARLIGAPTPQPGTPQYAATALAQQNPDFAARTHAVQQAQVGATATQATAQAAVEQVQQVAQTATQDTTPHDALASSTQTAQAAQGALESAPSTRAAVSVMGAALAQQQVDLAAQNAAMSDRLDALLTQQAQVALILSQAVAATGTATGVLAQQMEQQMEDQAQSAVSDQQAQVGAIRGIGAELQYLNQAPQDGTLDQFLSKLKGLR